MSSPNPKDKRAFHSAVHAIRAQATRDLPVISASHHQALQLLLSVEANDAQLTTEQRQNARNLQKHYYRQHRHACMNQTAASRHERRQQHLDTEGSGMPSGTINNGHANNNNNNNISATSIQDRVRQRVEKTLERKKTTKRFVSILEPQSGRAMTDFTMQMTDLQALKCPPERDIRVVPVPIKTLKDRAKKYAEDKEAEAKSAQEAVAQVIAKKRAIEKEAMAKIKAEIQAEVRAQVRAEVQEELRAELEVKMRTEIQEKIVAEDATRYARRKKEVVEELEVEEQTEAMTRETPTNYAERLAKAKTALDSTDAIPPTTNDNSKVRGATGLLPREYTITAARGYHASPIATRGQGQGTQPASPKPKYGNYANDDEDEEDEDRNDPVVPSVHKSAANSLDRRNTKRFKSDGPDASTGPPSFITAKEQMVIDEQHQEAKSYQNNMSHYLNRGGFNAPSTNGQRNHGNGTNAQTLINPYRPAAHVQSSDQTQQAAPAAGMLRPKIVATKRPKFKSPINRANSAENSEDKSGQAQSKSSNGIDEPVDDRLRNIEPKMIETIKNEIMESYPVVTWDDISGLKHAKGTIREAVILPIMRPDIFTGLRRPPKGLLLFGPPGTGKTLIGKCIASQAKATFFSISSSSLTSKWVGDGEKMVRALFAVARCHQPAVIFMDEIDSLLTQRTDGEVEASRRIKTEFLVQFDGVGVGGDEDRILIVGATNRPQEIDEAARRRFQKRLYIPLPESEGRHGMITNLLKGQDHDLTEEQIQDICERTKGYSGSDMNGLCREAALGPVRSIQGDILEIGLDALRPIQHKDFMDALSQVRASVSDRDLEMYRTWDAEYGSMDKR